MTLLDQVPGAAPPERVPAWWEEHWRGMPEFVQEWKRSWAIVDVHFREDKDYKAFQRKITAYGHFSGKAATRTKPFMLFSNFEVYKRSRRIWVAGGELVLPKHPLYIVSKGRAGRQLTSRALHIMGIPHYVVVEQEELDAYAARKLPLATLLVLDKQYQLDYDAFDTLGMARGKGSGPARNFAWDHAIAHGYAWYWVMDDNIQSFYRLGHNRKFLVKCGAFFRVMEAFCERYENVYMAGPHYEMFAPSRQKHPPFITNSRVYSCNLIRTDIPFRWRGRYNEDTDLSLRILKSGNCTVLFFAFLQNKLGTQRDYTRGVKLHKGSWRRTKGREAGGNTAILYGPDKSIDDAVADNEPGWSGVDVGARTQSGTARKSQMLYEMHPDVTRLMLRWGRPHHLVDYASFARNALRLKPGVIIPDGVDEFGMVQEQYRRSRKTSPSVASRKDQRFTRADVQAHLRSMTLGQQKAIRVHFNTQADMDKFAEITGLHVARDSGSVWFPPAAEKVGVGLLDQACWRKPHGV